LRLFERIHRTRKCTPYSAARHPFVAGTGTRPASR